MILAMVRKATSRIILLAKFYTTTVKRINTMRKLNYSLFGGPFLAGIVASFLFSSPLCAQTISGVAQICPGVPYTYHFDSPDYCDSRGTMTCEGCDQNSVR